MAVRSFFKLIFKFFIHEIELYFSNFSIGVSDIRHVEKNIFCQEIQY